jgi:hypothetical protein
VNWTYASNTANRSKSIGRTAPIMNAIASVLIGAILAVTAFLASESQSLIHRCGQP